MRSQPREALQQANEIRRAMAVVKRDIRRSDGSRRAARFLEDPSEIVARMTVGVFLKSIRRIGPRKMPELMSRAGLPRSAMEWRIGPAYETWAASKNRRTLTCRQRLALATVLRQRHASS